MSERNDGFGWNDQVEVPESGFELLPEGPAVFEIVKVDRQRKEYGQFGVCNVAVMTFLCSPVDGEGSAEVQSQFALVKRLGWKIVKLATACGFRKSGDGTEIDPRWWNRFVGATGRCEIGHRTYTGKKDGKEREVNEIVEFVAPAAEQSTLRGEGGTGRGDRETRERRERGTEGEGTGEFENIPF
jgi:hypothetical protein